VSDFVEQRALEATGEGRWRAQLHPDWTTWDPAGGYVAAVALRPGPRRISSVRRALRAICQASRASSPWSCGSRRRGVGAAPRRLRVAMAQGASGAAWTPDGRLVAAGSSQPFCRPRPERFR